MNDYPSIRSFVYWIVAGMGLHIGWGLITFLVDVAAKSVGR